ncbi:TSUP family transporter [Micromonospora aurantiaca (nom. illeg.)]|uniref:TSUP family transporter n=1 Tax=Micromonospora aurantiaca (nom. illeg.) TaxID=47850 RepID=UPI003F49DDFC
MNWRLVRWFALGAVPTAVLGGLLLAHAPLEPLKRLPGVLLIAVIIWRRRNRNATTVRPGVHRCVGAAIGSALLGSVGPLTAPFFLAYGLTRAAYIGTEAASALVMHSLKIAAYGAGALLDRTVMLSRWHWLPRPCWVPGAARPWAGGSLTDGFLALVEVGLIAAGVCCFWPTADRHPGRGYC